MQVSIPTLLQSKKFGAAVLASVLSFLGVREGLDVSQIALITAPLYAYIGGQGLADFGKEGKRDPSKSVPSGGIVTAETARKAIL